MGMDVQPIHQDSLFNIVATIVENNETIFGAAIAFEPEFFPEKGRYFSPYAFRDGDKVETMSLGGLNKSLSFNNESNMFVTFFLGIIDLQTGIMQYLLILMVLTKLKTSRRNYLVTTVC